MRTKRQVLESLNMPHGHCCDRHADYQPCTCLREAVFVVDDQVYKTTGDYFFEGVVVAVFNKRNGVVRYVVENADGLLHIFNGGQLMLAGYDRNGRKTNNQEKTT